MGFRFASLLALVTGCYPSPGDGIEPGVIDQPWLIAGAAILLNAPLLGTLRLLNGPSRDRANRPTTGVNAPLLHYISPQPHEPGTLTHRPTPTNQEVSEPKPHLNPSLTLTQQ